MTIDQLTQQLQSRYHYQEEQEKIKQRVNKINEEKKKFAKETTFAERLKSALTASTLTVGGVTILMSALLGIETIGLDLMLGCAVAPFMGFIVYKGEKQDYDYARALNDSIRARIRTLAQENLKSREMLSRMKEIKAQAETVKEYCRAKGQEQPVLHANVSDVERLLAVGIPLRTILYMDVNGNLEELNRLPAVLRNQRIGTINANVKQCISSQIKKEHNGYYTEEQHKVLRLSK